ncbi:MULTISPECIES: FUSC family protein [unclassified Rhizobium]|uniref:FUSC family protein n=1 Tax=unclassified Rhizobium TaxID=2613769 RepID=UPI001ADB3D36|nr:MULTISPECIES: FUSC family protein [unclassified Rhizobium]MBO9124471.1 FUSC family protein [Rhizobium sp. 16-488-2b]MBO9175007.1 FUSC family protein [Rhizobium sp. 16-488-2a]
MFSGFDFRDWLLANDPALSRLRMALRVTLSVALSFGVLLVIHSLLFPLPIASYGLGIVLAIEGGVAVRDKGGGRQLVTRLLGCAASLVVVVIAAGLEGHRLISDAAFLMIIFLAASARVFGPRGHAIGMFAFMSYFLGAYFQPPLAELSFVAIGPIVSSLIAHAVRSVVLPDDWRRDLLRSLESVQGRINQILFKIAALAAEGHVSDADRQELNQLEERLKEVVLMAESFIPRPPSGVFDPGTEPAGELAIRLFDAHLATEGAIMLCSQSLPSFELVHRIIEGHKVRPPTEDDEGPSAEARRALIRLGNARAELVETIEEGNRTGFADIAAVAEAPASASQLDFSLSNPLMRSALQITVAAAIAMTLGLGLSRERWFWAVLASFLVFTNTNSRGDTAMKALQRSVGTLFGIGIGLLLATLLRGHLAPALVITSLSIFLAFYFLQTSYATMTFFVSIALCLVYGMIGSLTLDLLLLRVEETALGAAVGTLVAFVVFPARTRGALDLVLDKWFAALDALLKATAAGEPRHRLIGLSQALDAAYKDLATTARPLGSSWSVVTRPGQVRQTLAIFLAATYWARMMAKNREASITGDDARQLIDASLARVTSASARRSECFFVDRKIPVSTTRHHPHASRGWRQGLEMIGLTLERLYPDA